MIKFISLLLLSLFSSLSFAELSQGDKSCFQFYNQWITTCRIYCKGQHRAMFVVAAANSHGSTQFDASLNNSLGFPAPGTLSCDIACAYEEPHNFSFYNPFYGPLIEFIYSPEFPFSKKLLTRVRETGAGQGETQYTFKWEGI